MACYCDLSEAECRAAGHPAALQPHNLVGSNMVDVFAGLPRSLKIGPYRYRVETKVMISDDGQSGECSPQDLTITLKAEQPSALWALDTVLHEINHAICHLFALSDGADEERIVSILASGWTL